jgi:putative modified peptide
MEFLEMSNLLLDGPLGEVLIRRLATDDGFRARFQLNAPECLREIGVPNAMLADFPSRCLMPPCLASKEAFASLLDDVGGEDFRLAMSFAVAKVGMGAAQRQAAQMNPSSGLVAPAQAAV